MNVEPGVACWRCFTGTLVCIMVSLAMGWGQVVAVIKFFTRLGDGDDLEGGSVLGVWVSVGVMSVVWLGLIIWLTTVIAMEDVLHDPQKHKEYVAYVYKMGALTAIVGKLTDWPYNSVATKNEATVSIKTDLREVLKRRQDGINSVMVTLISVW